MLDRDRIESVEPEELSDERVRNLINSIMKKFECGCGNDIMFRRISGHNSRPSCDECGEQYLI